MASSTADRDGPAQEIRLVDTDGMWVATDVETGVASQGPTREAALGNLDEAVALHRGETGSSVDTPEQEREVLRELGIDPDEVAEARSGSDGLPKIL
jgi:predicted RNase H-like HicB family nuclease